MWPCWLWPKRLPAPRICKSRIAMRKPDPNDVNAAFDELKADGTMQALADKYSLTLAD